jgi:amino acid transporter
MTREVSADGPSPYAGLAPLDEDELATLRAVGRHWQRAAGDPEQWRRALPVDLGRSRYPAEIEPRRLGRIVPVAAHNGQPANAAATPAPRRRGGGPPLRRLVLGAPLASTAIARERMRKLVALPVLSADVLSSVAYAPEAMLAVLVTAGAAGVRLSIAIAAGIAVLMLAVGLSYRQTIRAYPHGGGSYIVATDNLGRVPGLAAAAGLMTDYVLTVAVSIAAGVAAITSAIPALAPDTVPIGLGVIALLLAGNLRGVRQAGALFAVPTYAFLAMMAALVTVGLAHAAGRGFHAAPQPPLHATESLGVLLVLRAFASGATAMTGIEAISNAVPAFRPTAWRNARATLTWMLVLLIALFAGTVALIHVDGVRPAPDQTVLSELAHGAFGAGPLYVCMQAATAAVLLLAANTAFNDFPRLLFLMARDAYAPRVFLRLGDRLAFSNGIIALAAAAAAIFVAFAGRTGALIPLYAVGVFLAFTLSQTGMVLRWWRRREVGWRKSLAFNAAGGALSAIVLVMAAVTKFAAGAWVAVLVVALIMMLALRIRRHYDAVRAAIALRPVAAEVPWLAVGPPRPEPRRPADERDASAEGEESPDEVRHLTIVPIASLNLASVRALAYAASLRQPVLAVHISPAEDEAERFRGYWRAWGDHLPLEVIVSPYRAVVPPLVDHVGALHRQRPDITLTVVLPELVVKRRWHRALHNDVAARLARALKPLPKTVVTTVPFHLPS